MALAAWANVVIRTGISYHHQSDLQNDSTSKFCEDNNPASSFMVDLAMGYSYEQPTVVRELICER